MLRLRTLIFNALLCLVGQEALADNTYITVPVVSSQAIYEYDQHREKVCWQERVTRGKSQYYDSPRNYSHREYNDYTISSHDSQVASSALTGAVVGATIGHIVAEDRQSQAATTLIGGVIGLVVGGNLADHNKVKVRHRHRHSVPKATRQVCDYDLRERANIIGYQVQYRLAGQMFTTNSRYKPGRKIRLRIEPMLN